MGHHQALQDIIEDQVGMAKVFKIIEHFKTEAWDFALIT